MESEAAPFEYFRGPLQDAVLLAEPLRDLVVEVSYVDGYTPSTRALQDMESALRNLTHKRSIRIDPPVPIPNHEADSSRVWSDTDVTAAHFTTLRNAPVGDAGGIDGIAYLHVLYLDGTHSNGSRGRQMGTALVLFPDAFPKDMLADSARPPTDRTERYVLMHELGHAMGLVGCDVPMQRPHADPESPCHSHNERSVMWAGVEDGRATTSLLTDEFRTVPGYYDADDLADIAAYVKGR